MGLSNQMKDVSSDSIPIFVVLSALCWISYIRSLFRCLLNSLGFSLSPPSTSSSDPSSAAVGSGLAGLVFLADHLSASAAGPAVNDGCVFCLDGLREGERIRRLSCCHAFHTDCLDGWFDRMNLSCPICRAPLVAEERRLDAERRIGAQLLAWLSPY